MRVIVCVCSLQLLVCLAAIDFSSLRMDYFASCIGAFACCGSSSVIVVSLPSVSKAFRDGRMVSC